METNKGKRVLSSLLAGWRFYNSVKEFGQRAQVPVSVYLCGAAADLISKSDVKIPRGIKL